MVPRTSDPYPGAKDKPLPPPPPEESITGNDKHPEGKPTTIRRSTAPESPNLPSSSPNSVAHSLPIRPRTRSPFARGHVRSRSSGSALRAPQIARAHSSPMPESPETTSRFVSPRPISPLGSYGRHQSPLRKASEESFSSFGNDLDIDQTISENAELEVTPRRPLDLDAAFASPLVSSYNTFPRSRQRPPSPLSQIQQGQQGPFTPRASLRASTSTPSLANSHSLANSSFNEAFPSMVSMSSSSTSTPTSTRSRSPSISSLETIPDSPDAEIEAEQIARLKAAADRDEQAEDKARRKLSVGPDLFGRRSTRDKRKRWSVCGYESKENLDLETIWEDGT